MEDKRSEGGVNKVLRSVSQKAWLVHFPESFFWEFSVQSRRSHIFKSFVSPIVSISFVGVLIRDNIESLQSCFGDFCEKVEHDPCSSIEISDWQFSQDQIRQSISKSELFDSPFPPESMIPFASVVLINVLP